MNNGLVQIYTGDGKGKTTAAIGLAVRAAGAGFRCLFCQFLKGQDSAELAPLHNLGVEVLRTPEVTKFFWQMDDCEKKECLKSHEMCYNKLCKLLFEKEYGLVVLDEVFPAIQLGLLPLERVVQLVQGRPVNTELVMTGRDAQPELLALAEYVSEIRAVRHPYEQGVPARKGIEY